MQHIDLTIAATSFRRVSKELDKLSFELRENEAAMHRLVDVASWSEVAAEVVALQDLDRIIQTLDALAHYSQKMAQGVATESEHSEAVAGVKLQELRMRLETDDYGPSLKFSDSSSIDLF